MDGTKKIINIIKNSLANLSSFLLPKVTKRKHSGEGKSLTWSNNDDTVVIKRTDYESLQTELFEREEMIKRLKKIKDEKDTQIHEYEGMFTKFLKKKIETNYTPDNIKKRIENEMAIYRANENRLRSHIQALKRDLIISEEKRETVEDEMEQNKIHLQKKIENLLNNEKKYLNEFNKLILENQRLKQELEDKCKKIIELLEYCKFFIE